MRIAILAAAVTAMFLGAVAPAYAQAPACTHPARQVFGDLAAYYARPAEQRSHYGIAYVLDTRARGSATGLTLVVNQQRRVLSADASGRLLDPPTQEELAGESTVLCIGGGGLTLRTSLEPVLDLAQPVAVADIVAAMTEASAALRAQSGMIEMAQINMPVPSARGVRFRVNTGATGEAVWADGHRVALIRQGSDLVFRPEQAEGAVTLEFSEPPSAASFLIGAG